MIPNLFHEGMAYLPISYFTSLGESWTLLGQAPSIPPKLHRCCQDNAHAKQQLNFDFSFVDLILSDSNGKQYALLNVMKNGGDAMMLTTETQDIVQLPPNVPNEKKHDFTFLTHTLQTGNTILDPISKYFPSYYSAVANGQLDAALCFGTATSSILKLYP
jgi:hypothetical protein